jgi:hypothetical protein
MTKRSSREPDKALPPNSENPQDEKAAPQNPLMIVGVGASAGGFEAFKELLEALPNPTGMALVFIQHLEPSHESMLATLLGRSTRMPVVQASDGMKVEADHVYVAPPSANIIILNGVLTLQAIDKATGRHKTIDFFFRSLASDQAQQAVGVLLSGTASDGVLGLKAIKAEGGITLVQDEQSAKFDSMPRSAIMAGVADLVLPPAEIARELVRFKHHFPRLIRAPLPIPEEPNLPEEKDDLRRILALIWAVSHVDFTAYKQSTLRRRILRRMVLHKSAAGPLSPPGALVNSDMNILQFRGRTGGFLEPAPGGASFNLLRMCREGLMIPLHTAIHEATESGRIVRKEDVLFKGAGDDSYRVTLEINPITSPSGPWKSSSWCCSRISGRPTVRRPTRC